MNPDTRGCLAAFLDLLMLTFLHALTVYLFVRGDIHGGLLAIIANALWCISIGVYRIFKAVEN
jgi:hypothetical protein